MIWVKHFIHHLQNIQFFGLETLLIFWLRKYVPILIELGRYSTLIVVEMIENLMMFDCKNQSFLLRKSSILYVVLKKS